MIQHVYWYRDSLYSLSARVDTKKQLNTRLIKDMENENTIV
jgi:hypothetical protein